MPKVKDKYLANVYNIIRNLFYVDDGLGGGDTIKEAHNLKENVTAAMAKGGFELCKKFKSNANEVVDADPLEEVWLGDGDEEE